MWIAPPHRPYAPALARGGSRSRAPFHRALQAPKDALWAFEQALRAPECGAAFAWLATHDERALRRLQVAAREGRTWGALWRRPGQRGSATAAPLRLALAPQDGRLAVRVLKRRGAELPQPVLMDVAQPVAPAPALPAQRGPCAVADGRPAHEHRPPLDPHPAARARGRPPPATRASSRMPRKVAMPSLAHHFHTMAANNAWANHRLLAACAQLSQDDFTATRTSFFPSLKATLNHIVTVDWYYVDALERALARAARQSRRAPLLRSAGAVRDVRGDLRRAARGRPAACSPRAARLTDAQLEMPVADRRGAPASSTRRATRLLAHLFQHQIHHRGQAHAMLAGTSVAPPQLDEFFCANEAHLRARELAELGLSEAAIWRER